VNDIAEVTGTGLCVMHDMHDGNTDLAAWEYLAERVNEMLVAEYARGVAAERARCVAVAEDAAMQAHGVLHRRDMDLAPESVVSYWSGTHHSALSIRKKLDAALPPITPEKPHDPAFDGEDGG